MVGEGAALLVKRALAAARVEQPPDAVARFLDFYNRRLLKHTRPYPGIPDVVRQAREHARVVVLTNKPREPSERILEGLGMRDLFDEIAGGDGPMPRKPDPTALRALMETAGSTEATTLMVGDSPIDYQTARNAGVQYCLVSFGFGFSNFTSDESVESEWIVSDTDGLADRIRKFAHQ
jgi:phosphoglycolate phosphatase